MRIIRTLHWNGQQSAGEITQKEGITGPFAYKILKKLEKAGIIQIFRGPTGGYRLLRPVSELTMLDIIMAVNEQVFITECMEKGYKCTSSQSGCCAIHKELSRIQGILNRELSDKSMEELLRR